MTMDRGAEMWEQMLTLVICIHFAYIASALGKGKVGWTFAPYAFLY